MDESQDLIYQESEVLWAKIRGYPWWPAYVRDVHEADVPADFQYTVIFFGDNTKYLEYLQKVSSRLGPSKLRKFPEHYAECYLKAKTNKKLRQSIQKAQERLNENHQDVSFYQNIRNDLVSKKKKLGTVSESRLSSSEKGDPVEVPDLVKHKTQQPLRTRKRRQKRRQEQIFEQQSGNNAQIQKQGKSNEKIEQICLEARRRRSEKLPTASIFKKSPVKAQQMSSQMQEESPEPRPKRVMKSKQVLQSPRVDRERYNMRSNQKSKQKLEQQQVHDQRQESIEPSLQKQPIAKVSPVKARKGRKGRPPKNQQTKPQKPKLLKQLLSRDQSSSENHPQIVQQRRPRKKPFPNPTQKHQQISEQGTLSQKQQQRIKNSLTNRKQLTKLLLSMPINTGNIKQILDLGTSIALQEGPITKNVNLLLCTLKATLLHKYFPDNNKHRKKYQKMTKEKKKAIIHSQEEDNEDQQGSEEDDKNRMREQGSQQKYEQVPIQRAGKSRQHNNKQNKEQNRPRSKKVGQKYQNLTQIRKKANEKLQKMIKKAGVEDKARDYALRIESTFQTTADAQGQLYRNVAYRRMRNLKTKLLDFGDRDIGAEQVREYLDQIVNTYESQGLATTNS